MSVPTSIRAHREQRVLELQWPTGPAARLPFRFLRGRCPCAGCVDENTGIRQVDVEDVPEEVAPQNLAFSGNYALKIQWSDGHDTGLYTFDWLRKLTDEWRDRGGPA